MATVNVRKRRNRRGFALLLTLLILPLMAMLAFTLTRMGVNNLQTSRVRVDSRQAAYVSEAGAEEAYQILLKYPEVSTSATTGFPSRGVTGANVIVTNNNLGSGTQSITAPNGATVPRGFAYVQSVATIDGVTRSTGYLVRLAPVEDPLLDFGMFMNDGSNISGNFSMDAYDSSQGPYVASQSRAGGQGEQPPSTRPYNAKGGSNGTLTSGGSSEIYGGLQSNLGVTMPTVTAPASPTQVLNGLTIGSNQSRTFGAGATADDPDIILINGDVDIKGTLNIAGPTKFYITGGLTMNAQADINNTTQKAKNLWFYGVGSASTLWKLNGGANAYAVFYAPSREIRINGGSRLFGAVIGDSVTALGTADFTQDLDLGKPPVGLPAAVMYRQRF